MEKKPEKETYDPILHFVLDGVLYSLEQNGMSLEVARTEIQKWFPDAQVLDRLPPAQVDEEC